MELFPIVDDAVVVDRSTLEAYADCPRAAAFVAERGEPTSREMASGQSVHDAISAMLQAYVRAGGDMSPTEIAHELTCALRNVRPDLQPDALTAVPDWMRWSIGRMLAERHAGDILRFDGGDGDQCGQLARDITLGREVVRVTSELDLLMTTRCPDVLAEHDWKTGWMPWTAASVLESFQFRLHWWIVSEVYPDAQHLDVTIWATRHGKVTDRVRFSRRDLPDIEAQVLSAAGDWSRARGAIAASCEARPFESKCSLCAFAVDCVDAEIPSGDPQTPEQRLSRLVQLNAAAALLEKQLWKDRDARGADIVAGGTAFGWDKPKGKPKRPANPLYAAAGPSDEAE